MNISKFLSMSSLRKSINFHHHHHNRRTILQCEDSREVSFAMDMCRDIILALAIIGLLDGEHKSLRSGTLKT